MSEGLPLWATSAKPVLTILCLTALWTWESLLPLVADRPRRWRHGARNAAVSLLNTAALGVVFGAATVGVATWSTENRIGLLHWLAPPLPWRMLPAILLLDGWLYVWHRLNHRSSLLWRFHRMHHSDRELDVTTATRFHLGEHFGAATLRLGLIPLFGFAAIEILAYEVIVVAVTMFHHANISLGRFDRSLRWLIVTPRMHQIHHSRLRAETDSNYSVLLSVWDRLGGTYRVREGHDRIEVGLDELNDDRWQSFVGMLKTPFVNPSAEPRAKLLDRATSEKVESQVSEAERHEVELAGSRKG